LTAVPASSVRDATFDVMRRFGMTTIFGNPGSTEITFLTDLPSDIEFVLGLHEGAVVGIATGYAIARGEPSFVNLHTTPGLGNAINAIANARDCRAPLVIVVGQQDRRQLAYEPFLTGRRLEQLAGDYPVWTNLPVRAQDVPGSIARAYHEAVAGAGPALVVVPMGDWLEPMDELGAGAPVLARRPRAVGGDDVLPFADLIADAESPALVVGMGAGSPEAWDAVTSLAERLRSPVFQEAFSRRAGFPQDHELFTGPLPWRRRQMREALAPHDLVIALGTSAFRMYILEEPEPFVAAETKLAVITEDSAEAHRSPCDVALVAPVAEACRTLVTMVPAREGAPPPARPRPPTPDPPRPGEPLRPAHVFAALAERLPADVVLIEETPSSQPELYERIPARAPLGLVAGGNGGLGFGVAGTIGLRMGLPSRPVVAVVGDGSALYSIQALWSAAQYGVGALLVVMGNGRYAVMDGLARARGAAGPWPAFDGIDVAGIARSFGCPAAKVQAYDELTTILDEVVPGLSDRQEPLVLDVTVDR
jgi:benzoylformate decarboxylase